MRPILLSATAALALSAGAATAQDWTRTATLYLWVPAVIMELQDKTDVTFDRQELLENLEFAFSGEYTAARGDWIFGGDIFYSSVGVDGSLSFPVGSGSPDVDDIKAAGDATIATSVISGFAGYKLIDVPSGTFYGTVRLQYASIDAEVDVETDSAAFSVDADASLLDLTVGLRGQAYLNDDWSIPFIVDVGAGDSRYTFQMFAGLTYEFGQNGVTVGYRKLEWLLPDSNEYLNKVVYQGPVLAYSRRF